MKKLFAIVVLVLFAQLVQADTFLKFRDGSANVWDNIYEKGVSYCTNKSGMELCIPKSDVVLKKEVPADTDPLEYGKAATTNLPSQSDRIGADEYAKFSDKKKSQNAAEDQQKARKREGKVRFYGEDKVQQMERSGQSIPVKP